MWNDYGHFSETIGMIRETDIRCAKKCKGYQIQAIRPVWHKFPTMQYRIVKEERNRTCHPDIIFTKKRTKYS